MWKFKDYYVGTFCFDYSKGFGCGDDLGLEQMQKIVVDSVLDTETFKTKFGANFELPFKWSYRSKDCEYCRPEICFPESNLVTWKSVSKYIFWDCERLYSQFNQGTNVSIHKNCTQNDPACNCRGPTEIVSESTSNVKYSIYPSNCLVINPIRMTPRKDSDEKSTKDLFNVEDLFPPGSNIHNIKFGVVDPSGLINWLYPRVTPEHRISLISHNPMDSNEDKILSLPLHDNSIPVIALTQYIKDPRMKISLVQRNTSGSEQEVTSATLERGEMRSSSSADNSQSEMFVRSKLFTIIMGHFRLAPSVAGSMKSKESEPELRILLMNSEGEAVSYLAQRIQIEFTG
jgi:hypothetical protein